MKPAFYTIAIAAFFLQMGITQTYMAGETYFGTNNYIEYKAGNLPIIISAAHGGGLEPDEIPNRDCPGCVYVKDAFTEELIREMYDAIFDLFGCYPHIIINRLHRRKLDANRSIGDAADGNPIGEQAWIEFQEFIEISKDSIEANYGKGVYFDLHGHGHDIQRLELGYRITKPELQLADQTLNEESYVNSSSIKNLVNNNLSNFSLSELLRGTESFEQLYEEQNYPAVPSQDDPYPEEDDPYFRGGYNTDRHGSKLSGTIDAIQIECNMDGLRDTGSNRAEFAAATARVIKDYLEQHYFEIDFLNTNCELVISSVEESEQDAIIINTFPNPIKTYLNIELIGINQSSTAVVLINGLGQVIWKRKGIDTTSFFIDFQHFPTGTYYLKVATKDFVGFKTIIK